MTVENPLRPCRCDHIVAEHLGWTGPCSHVGCPCGKFEGGGQDFTICSPRLTREMLAVARSGSEVP